MSDYVTPLLKFPMAWFSFREELKSLHLPENQMTPTFPAGSDGKKSAYNVGDQGLIPGYGRSPGEGHGNPLQCSCLENRMDRGAGHVTVHGVTKSWTHLSSKHSQHMGPS